MTEYKARLELKSKLQQELLSFVEVDEVREEIDNDRDVQEIRDEWIDELNDRLTNTLDVIGYHKGLEYALAFRYWNFEDATFDIKNAEDLGFNACYEYVQEYGLVYDVVDAFLVDEFNVDLNIK